MKKSFLKKQLFLFAALVLFSSFFFTACGEISDLPDPTVIPKTGQTTFVTREDGNNSDGMTRDNAAPGYNSQNGGSFDAGSSKENSKNNAPSGREGTVQEADLYRVSGNFLYYLNTYKGLTIFDLKDRKHPKKLSSLPVFGYPIEMFVENNIAYAIVRDALYLLKVNGKFEFKRRHVSQLVTIDISNPKAPKVLQRLDIKGQLKEGVSRKIDKTIYVVSYVSRYYWWGWYYNRRQQEEQATVYSFNIENPRQIKEIQHIALIANRPKSKRDNNGNESYSFSGVTIAATSNTLLVGENWHYYKYSNRRDNNGCSQYENYNFTKLNIVDISDPKGKINIHTRFIVRGRLTDQFKQTYVYNKKTKKGTYFGIYQRQEWKREGCQRTKSLIKNTLVSIDITDGSNPTVLDELVFGKPNETVRGSLFDTTRNVLYAITAVRRDPFYAISFADPKKLKILSEIDGLSGDINLFRFIKNRQFLLAVGRDNSSACSGFDKDRSGWRSTNLAVSIIDVRDLSKARLVQRKCIAIKNAGWVSSQINWNLDQAHKMIGLHEDGKTSLLTIPVNYNTRTHKNGWWWYDYKSAIGIMKWDLSKYDDTKSEKEQNVIENIATIIHPKGSVKRTIITSLNNKRSVINLSDTHLSLVDLQDLRQPQLLSTYEIAPYIRTVYRFGDYLVEQVNVGRYYSDYNEFRVKKIGSGNINDAPILATIKSGRIQNVIRWGKYLVLFSRPIDTTKTNRGRYPIYDYKKSIIRIYDFSNPAKPVARGSLILPASLYPNYYFYCGGFGMTVDCGYPYYYYGNSSRWITTAQGIAFMTWKYDYNTKTAQTGLYFLNFTNPNKISYKYHTISNANHYLNIIRLDSKQFFLMTRKILKKGKYDNGRPYTTYIYYAEPWILGNNGWKAGTPINIPGQLMKAFRSGKTIKFLTRDYQYIRRNIPNSSGKTYTQYQIVSRLFLLEQTSTSTATLRASKILTSWHLQQLIINNGRLYIKSTRDWYWMRRQQLNWNDYSDYLMIFDLSKNTFSELFSKALRTYNVQLIGIQNKRLFIRLPSEGILVADVTNGKTPKALHFERTLGWASNIEFSKDKAYIAAGYFGIYQLDLNNITIPSEPM